MRIINIVSSLFLIGVCIFFVLTITKHFGLRVEQYVIEDDSKLLCNCKSCIGTIIWQDGKIIRNTWIPLTVSDSAQKAELAIANNIVKNLKNLK